METSRESLRRMTLNDSVCIMAQDIIPGVSVGHPWEFYSSNHRGSEP